MRTTIIIVVIFVVLVIAGLIIYAVNKSVEEKAETARIQYLMGNIGVAETKYYKNHSGFWDTLASIGGIFAATGGGGIGAGIGSAIANSKK